MNAPLRPRCRVIKTDEADLEHRALSPIPRRDVKQVLRNLRFGPSAEAISLEGFDNLWRERLDGLRVIFEFYPSERLIRVIRIRPRSTAYEGLERPPRSPR